MSTLTKTKKKTSGQIYYAAHREELLEKSKRWRLKNKKHISEYNRKYRARLKRKAPKK